MSSVCGRGTWGHGKEEEGEQRDVGYVFVELGRKEQHLFFPMTAGVFLIEYL